MNSKINILIVDDEAELRKTVASILRSSMPEITFTFFEAENGKEAIEKFKSRNADLVLMDVRMPEMNGLQALTLIKEESPQTFVVLMTAHSNLKDAVAAIKEGAYDYIEKPVQPGRLIEIVKRALDARSLVNDLAQANPIFDDDIETEFVGNSNKMKEVFNLIYRLCKVETTVLIRGENGTGKELVAKAIQANSPRKNGPFIVINCGAIPENLMESELFGHEKGAFTGAIERKIGKFQLANNGTLFLDEIGELKPELQVKLLRVLQERKFNPIGSSREVKTDARIIAATNRNLEKMIEDQSFREDLFYRLNVMPIYLPPLRDRTDDIEALLLYFFKKYSNHHGRLLGGIEPDALAALKAYRWPGNIRELENFVERAYIIENSDRITAACLTDQMRMPSSTQSRQTQTANKSAQGVMDFEAFKEQAEKEFIINALKANHGRINKTVAEANIPKNTLLRKIKKYGINVKEYAD